MALKLVFLHWGHKFRDGEGEDERKTGIQSNPLEGKEEVKGKIRAKLDLRGKVRGWEVIAFEETLRSNRMKEIFTYPMQTRPDEEAEAQEKLSNLSKNTELFIVNFKG